MAITNQGLQAAKAKGVKLLGTTAKSIENQNAAAERAEARCGRSSPSFPANPIVPLPPS
jgi:hypothetical protein